jgi:hypothetical protein
MCISLGSKRRLHSSLEKSIIIERAMEYLKDRTKILTLLSLQEEIRLQIESPIYTTGLLYLYFCIIQSRILFQSISDRGDKAYLRAIFNKNI